MEIWIWITLVAATTQTLRSAGQKQMKSVMGDFGASYIRFSYALPFACVWLYAVMSATGQAMPQTTPDFWLWVSIGEPSIASGLEELHQKGIDEVLIVPLYPQHAMATTETILVLAEEIRAAQYPKMSFTHLPAFYHHVDLH